MYVTITRTVPCRTRSAIHGRNTMRLTKIRENVYVRKTRKQQSLGVYSNLKSTCSQPQIDGYPITQSGELHCLSNSALHHHPSFLVDKHGMRRIHPSAARAQVGEGWCPTWTLPPTALTSDSHTVGFLAIRSSNSSVQLCPGSRKTVTSATTWPSPRVQGQALLPLKAHLIPVRDTVFPFPQHRGTQMAHPCLSSEASHLPSVSLGSLRGKMGGNISFPAHPMKYLWGSNYSNILLTVHETS
jgi:hypothetical protein